MMPTKNHKSFAIVSGCLIAATLGITGAGQAGAATSHASSGNSGSGSSHSTSAGAASDHGAQSTPSRGTPSGRYQADGASFRTYADGNGGNITIKTRADGTTVKTDNDGNVMYDSRKSTTGSSHTGAADSSSSNTGSADHSASSQSAASTRTHAGNPANSDPSADVSGGNNVPTSIADAPDGMKAVKSSVSDVRNANKTVQAIRLEGDGARSVLQSPVGNTAANKLWDKANPVPNALRPLDKVAGGATAAMDGLDAADAYANKDWGRAVGSGVSAGFGVASAFGGGLPAAAGGATWNVSYKVAGPKLESYVRESPSMQQYRSTVQQLETEGGPAASIGYTLAAGPGHVLIGTAESVGQSVHQWGVDYTNRLATSQASARDDYLNTGSTDSTYTVDH